MILEKQVCSLKLAKKLSTLGVEQDSLWYWCPHESNNSIHWDLEMGHGGHADWYAAYTVAELGEMLDDDMCVWRGGLIVPSSSWYGGKVDGGRTNGCVVMANTEADAKAKLLIWHLFKGAGEGEDNLEVDMTNYYDDIDCLGNRDECEEVNDVNHPSHYIDGGIETIDFIEAKELGFHLGNAVKYITHAGKKDSDRFIQDLEKARWYLDRAIQNDGDLA